MANSILTHDMLAARALFDLQNNLAFTRNVYKGYSSEFGTPINGYKKGDSVRIMLPNKYRATSGTSLGTAAAVDRANTTVTVDEQYHVPMNFTETELTLDIAEFSRKYTNPATIALANIVDKLGCAEYVNIYNQVGTPGTTPSTYSALTDAAERLDNEAVPMSPRVVVFSPAAHWSMADGELKGVYEQKIVGGLIRKGFYGTYADFDVYKDQNMQTHTVGAHGGTPVMNGATAEGATSLVTDGWTASTTVLKKGDVITIANVLGVNPISGDVWEGSQSRQFTVTADVTSDAGGNATIGVSPAVISSAAGTDLIPYQTIDTLPANNAAITVVGTASTGYMQNLAFHPDCFACTVVPYARPMSADKSVSWGQASDPQMGLSITVISAFNISDFDEDTRLDILFGWDTIRPELGVRITG